MEIWLQLYFGQTAKHKSLTYSLLKIVAHQSKKARRKEKAYFSYYTLLVIITGTNEYY